MFLFPCWASVGSACTIVKDRTNDELLFLRWSPCLSRYFSESRVSVLCFVASQDHDFPEHLTERLSEQLAHSSGDLHHFGVVAAVDEADDLLTDAPYASLQIGVAYILRSYGDNTALTQRLSLGWSRGNSGGSGGTGKDETETAKGDALIYG